MRRIRLRRLIPVAAAWAALLVDPEPQRAQVGRSPVQSPIQAARLVAHDFLYFSISVPTGADVHAIAAQVDADSALSFLVRDSLSSTALFVSVFRLPKGMTVRDWARRDFVRDSTQSADNGWGLLRPVRPTRLGKWPAWGYGEEEWFNLYAARRGSAVAITCKFDSRPTHQRTATLRRNCARILSTFRWRGA